MVRGEMAKEKINYFNDHVILYWYYTAAVNSGLINDS